MKTAQTVFASRKKHHAHRKGTCRMVHLIALHTMLLTSNPVWALEASSRNEAASCNPLLTGTMDVLILLAACVAALLIFISNRRLKFSVIESEHTKAKLMESEALFRTLSDTSTAGIFMRCGAQVMMVNHAMSKLTGYSEDELLTMKPFEFIHADDRASFDDWIAPASTDDNAAANSHEFRILTKTGTERWMSIYSGWTQYHEQPCCVYTMFDITDQRRLEDALRLSEERHRLLADNASDVIWTMDLDGHFTYISPSVEKLRGYTAEEAMQQSLDESLTPGSKAMAKAGLLRVIEAVRNGLPVPQSRNEYEQPCKDGSSIWAEITTSGMYDSSGRFVGILGVSRDITDKKRIQDHIQHMAHFDTLTELPNRALFFDRVNQALTICKREKTEFALMFLDLDKFKPVNDTYGHAIGDLLLKEAAARMRASVRESDSVGRIGGDEFVVLLPTIHSAQDGLQVAEKIRLALNQPFHISGNQLEISCSIGVATYPEHGINETELARNADAAMYRAKNSGRNNVKLYSSKPAKPAD